MPDKPPQRVVCAANRNTKGQIVCSPRHYDALMRAQLDQKADWGDHCLHEQGFVDQFGQFLTREEAHVIAFRENQVIRRVGGDEKTLYSENLY